MNNGIEIHKKYEMVTGAELEILDYYNKNINNPDETEKVHIFVKHKEIMVEIDGFIQY